MLRWLWHDPTDLGHVHPWNEVRAEREAAATARMLLGWAGNVQVVGSRRDEQIMQDRERRLAEMRRRQMKVVLVLDGGLRLKVARAFDVP